MESRKRPHEGDAPLSVKKRALVNTNDAPVASTASEEEPQDVNELENFRKEAIYRRMKHYSREFDRSQIQITALENRTSSYVAALSALEASWDQLVSQVQLYIKSEQLSDLNFDIEPYQISKYVKYDDHWSLHYQNSLQDRESKTLEFLGNILQRAPQLVQPSESDIRTACKRLQSEVAASRGELEMTRVRLEEASTGAESYLQQLNLVENRLERLKSQTVQRLEAKIANRTESEEKPAANVDTDVVMKTEPDTDVKTITQNGHSAVGDAEDWRLLAEERAKAAQQLQFDLQQVQNELDQRRLEGVAPSVEALQSHELYKVLQNSIDIHKNAEVVAQAESDHLREQVQQLIAEKHDYQTKIQSETSMKLNEMKTMLEKRDGDLNRLREARDALQSELYERKAKEADRLVAVNQSKILTDARGERVALLVSENQRLKGKLAAREGEESFFAFITGKPQDESFVRELQEKVEVLQRGKDSLEATLKELTKDHPDVTRAAQAEAEARAKVLELQSRLDKFESVYGTSALGSSGANVQQLAAELQAKEEELRRTRLELKASVEETPALYTEIERLSGLWENLDKQLKHKVLDLSAMEEKLSRITTEKAKADNKYFATMRLKDAADTERKTLARNLEKQVKVIEKLAESEKSLTYQLSQTEKENQLQQKVITEKERSLATTKQQVEELQARLGVATQRETDMKAVLSTKTGDLAKYVSENNKLSEECAKMRRNLEKQGSVIRSFQETGGNSELQDEYDKVLGALKCSTCKTNFRSHVIIKCMHTFCKECIDTRIATRQRKCPACAAPFGTGDILPYYLQ